MTQMSDKTFCVSIKDLNWIELNYNDEKMIITFVRKMTQKKAGDDGLMYLVWRIIYEKMNHSCNMSGTVTWLVVDKWIIFQNETHNIITDEICIIFNTH